MNTDFRLSIGYFRHPKVQKLKRKLGSDAVLAHAQLLSFAAQERPTGTLTNMDADDIAIACDYSGDMDVFLQTLQDLRLLDAGEDGALALHDWAEHNPFASTAPERSEQARSAALIRWGGKGGAKSGSKPAADAPAVPTDAPSSRTDASSSHPSNADAPAVYADRINEHCAEHQTALPLASVSNAPSETILPDPSGTSEANPTQQQPNLPTRDPSLPDPECFSVVVATLSSLGVTEGIAQDLARRRSCEEIMRQVDWLPTRIQEKADRGKPVRLPSAFLVTSIEERWNVPDTWAQVKKAQSEAAARAESAQRRAEEGQAQREASRTDRKALDAAFEALRQDPVALEDFEEAVIERAKKSQFNCDSLRKHGKLHETVLRPIRDALLREKGLVHNE